MSDQPEYTIIDNILLAFFAYVLSYINRGGHTEVLCLTFFYSGCYITKMLRKNGMFLKFCRLV